LFFSLSSIEAEINLLLSVCVVGLRQPKRLRRSSSETARFVISGPPQARVSTRRSPQGPDANGGCDIWCRLQVWAVGAEQRPIQAPKDRVRYSSSAKKTSSGDTLASSSSGHILFTYTLYRPFMRPALFAQRPVCVGCVALKNTHSITILQEPF
jgi:hypothetical protein